MICSPDGMLADVAAAKASKAAFWLFDVAEVEAEIGALLSALSAAQARADHYEATLQEIAASRIIHYPDVLEWARGARSIARAALEEVVSASPDPTEPTPTVRPPT